MKALKRATASVLRRWWLVRNRHAFVAPVADRKPRLLVDISVIYRHDAATGIQRVVRSIWSHLDSLEGAPFEVCPVFADQMQGYCFAPRDFLSNTGRPERVAVGLGPGDKFLGLDLAAHYLPNYAAQLAAWRANGASVHIVVYDLLPLTRPDWFPPQTSFHFARWLETLKANSDQALCISDYVAQELRRRTANTNLRPTIGRLHLSGDIAGSLPTLGLPPAVGAMVKHARNRPAVLMVGTIEPRKGYDHALDVFEHIWAQGHDGPDLIIVGKSGWKTKGLQQRIRSHPERGRRLHWLENVSDEALAHFYRACCCLFAASYDEGLGLPLLEAATHRRWVLARDIPVFREQSLPNVRYFVDDDPRSVAGQLLQIIRAASVGPAPVTSMPSWSACGNRLLTEIGFKPYNRDQSGPVLRMVS